MLKIKGKYEYCVLLLTYSKLIKDLHGLELNYLINLKVQVKHKSSSVSLLECSNSESANIKNRDANLLNSFYVVFIFFSNLHCLP